MAGVRKKFGDKDFEFEFARPHYKTDLKKGEFKSPLGGAPHPLNEDKDYYCVLQKDKPGCYVILTDVEFDGFQKAKDKDGLVKIPLTGGEQLTLDLEANFAVKGKALKDLATELADEVLAGLIMAKDAGKKLWEANERAKKLEIKEDRKEDKVEKKKGEVYKKKEKKDEKEFAPPL